MAYLFGPLSRCARNFVFSPVSAIVSDCFYFKLVSQYTSCINGDRFIILIFCLYAIRAKIIFTLKIKLVRLISMLIR